MLKTYPCEDLHLPTARLSCGVDRYFWNYDWHEILTLLTGLMKQLMLLIKAISDKAQFQTQWRSRLVKFWIDKSDRNQINLIYGDRDTARYFQDKNKSRVANPKQSI